MNDPFGFLLPGRNLSPQQRRQAELEDQLWASELEVFFDRLHLRSGARVLVYDCGLGFDLPRLAKRVAPLGEVIGVQPDPFLAHEARHLLRDYPGQGIRVVVGDPASDPIPDGVYEVVFLAWRKNSLQPSPRQPGEVSRILQRLRPWLSPQGRLAVWEDSAAGMHLYPKLPLLERTTRRWQRLQSQENSVISRSLAGEFAFCNILLESAHPIQKAEVPGSATGRWFEHWLQNQGPTWLEHDLISQRQWKRLQREIETRQVNPRTLYFSSQAFGVVGRSLTNFIA